ncbi:unnamed protein product [Parajaminaea phylloscopi]
MTIDASAGSSSAPAVSVGKAAAPTLASLQDTLCSPSPPTPLDAQFRALFTIKSLSTTSTNPDDLPEGIRIIGRALQTSDSALLKHELAYVLGQMQDSRAIPTLTKVLEDETEHAMVRHEAAEAMGAIADPVALSILEHYQHDKDVSVRETCELAIRKINYEVQRRKEQPVATSAQPTDSPFAPIDPAPAFDVSPSKEAAAAAAASSSSADVLAQIPTYRTTLLDQTQTLFDRYRAMFSLRNAVHAARRESEQPNLSPQQRSQVLAQGKDAVLALCDSLSDGSALFRHEICFVFGELAHASCVPAMLKVLADSDEHEMVRHEAAEALGAVVEEGDEDEVAKEGGASLTEQVIKELKRWAEDLEAPRVVRESCIVALDEMAYNDDPSQFQPMDNALPEASEPVAVA